jgi:hypothetical protein
LIVGELKWSGINTCRSVDSGWVRRARFLSSGNGDETEDFGGVLRTAKRACMTYGRPEGIRPSIMVRL